MMSIAPKPYSKRERAMRGRIQELLKENDTLTAKAAMLERVVPMLDRLVEHELYTITSTPYMGEDQKQAIQTRMELVNEANALLNE